MPAAVRMEIIMFDGLRRLYPLVSWHLFKMAPGS